MLAVGNASLLEMLWTLFGLIGVVIGWSNLENSRHDIQALRDLNGHTLKAYTEMRIIAYGHYRNNLFRFSKHFVVLLIGVISMALPPTSFGHNGKVTPTGIVITVGFFIIVVLMLMASALDQRQREALEDVAIEDSKNS